MRVLATRQHDDVADFLAKQLDKEVDRLSLNYKVSGRIVIATLTKDGQEQGRFPDVSVVSLDIWRNNRAAYSALREPLQVAVEVVSTNWEDDYIDKLDEYQRLGIPEYWIVDYLAIGSRVYLGKPKVPTVFVYQLDDKGIYQPTAYRGSDKLGTACASRSHNLRNFSRVTINSRANFKCLEICYQNIMGG